MSRPGRFTSKERRARLVAGRPPLRRGGRSGSRLIGGVAAGIAGFVGASPWAVRWLWLFSLPLSGGLTGLVYLLLWALIPSEPA